MTDLSFPIVVLHQRSMVAGGRRYDVLDAAGRRRAALGARGGVGLQPFHAYGGHVSGGDTPAHDVRRAACDDGGLPRLNENQLRERQRWSLDGAALVAGLYLNEVVLKAWPVDGESEALARAYRQALTALADGRDVAWTLRRVEWALFTALDLGVDTLSVTPSAEVRPAGATPDAAPAPALWFVLQRGWVPMEVDAAPGARGIQAGSLRRWAAVMQAYGDTPNARTEDDWFALLAHLAELDPGLVRGLRDVHRLILHQYLGGQELGTRQLWQEPVAKR